MTHTLLHNYHTHTVRCRHAYGSDEEYVQWAIRHGMKTLGFSDHIPLRHNVSALQNLPPHAREQLLLTLSTARAKFRGADEATMIRGLDAEMKALGIVLDFPLKHYDPAFWKMDICEVDEYVTSIRALQEKYKGQIEIFVGFESEFILAEADFYRQLLSSGKVDYLILGAHLYDYFDAAHNISIQATPQMIEAYANHCVTQMESGLFAYLCHPDLYMKTYVEFDDTCQRAAHQICKKSAELQVPIELNCEGMRAHPRVYGAMTRQPYPFPDFWAIAGEHQCPVVIGVDAHKPEDLDSESIQDAFAWADRFQLNLLPENRLNLPDRPPFPPSP